MADSRARAEKCVPNSIKRVPASKLDLVLDWRHAFRTGSRIYPKPYGPNMERIVMSASTVHIFPRLRDWNNIVEAVEQGIFSVKPDQTSTRKNIKHAGQSLCKYLIALGIRPESDLQRINEIKIKRVREPVKHVIRYSQVVILIEILKFCQKRTEYYKHYDILLVLFLFFTGVRLSELVNLKLTDLDLERGVVQVINGKAGRNRQIPISKELKPTLEKYINEYRPKVDSEYLFLLKAGQRLNTDRLHKRIKQVLAMGNFEGSAHSFRRGFASYYSSKNVPITFMQKLLGHASILTTQLYLSVSDDEIFTRMQGI